MVAMIPSGLRGLMIHRQSGHFFSMYMIINAAMETATGVAKDVPLRYSTMQSFGALAKEVGRICSPTTMKLFSPSSRGRLKCGALPCEVAE